MQLVSNGVAGAVLLALASQQAQDAHVAVQLSRTLLNLSMVPELRPRLKEEVSALPCLPCTTCRSQTCATTQTSELHALCKQLFSGGQLQQAVCVHVPTGPINCRSSAAELTLVIVVLFVVTTQESRLRWFFKDSSTVHAPDAEPSAACALLLTPFSL